jgi:hypothetical protein
MYGTNKSSVSVSTGTETAVTVGGIYASAYQPNVSVNGTGNVQAVKMPQAPATTKEMPPASVQYRQATAPAKGLLFFSILKRVQMTKSVLKNGSEIKIKCIFFVK